jgi:tetratricopeptide (TPR) repeat protein
VESEDELSNALNSFENLNEVQGLCVTWACRAQQELLLLRARPKPIALQSPENAALTAGQRAFELADDTARTKFPLERDFVRAHWLVGAAHCAGNNLQDAERHLNEALERCRRISMVEMEADILIDHARFHIKSGVPEEASRLAEEALSIAERSEYVMQGADAHLELAKLALARKDKKAALHHATEARRLATCDGPPDYTYKVAYDEAVDLLRRAEDPKTSH